MTPLRVTARQAAPGQAGQRVVQVWTGRRLIGWAVLRPDQTLGDFIKQSVREAEQAQEVRT